MPSYAAFLRGINLGPTNKIAMPRLRALAEGLGWSEVRTYINSGNLLFTADGADRELARALERAIADELSLKIDVTVRTEDQLRTLLAQNPYHEGDPSRVTVAFLTGPPPAGAEQRVAALATDHEPFVFAGSEVWVHYGQGLGTSKLAVQFSKALGVSATVRNVRTVTKVVDLFG
jgi:uncharacterized protein (DUF1697 family)